MSVSKGAQSKLNWALNKVLAMFTGTIERERFGNYQIGFVLKGKRVPEEIDQRAIDDCVPSNGYITNELLALINEVTAEFAARA